MKYVFAFIAALMLSTVARAQNKIVLSVGGHYVDNTSDIGFDRRESTDLLFFKKWTRTFSSSGDETYGIDGAVEYQVPVAGDHLRMGVAAVAHGTLEDDASNGYSDTKELYKATATLNLNEQRRVKVSSVGGGPQITYVARRFGIDFGDGMRLDPFAKVRMLFMANTAKVKYKASGNLAVNHGEGQAMYSGSKSCGEEDRTELGFGGELGGGAEFSIDDMFAVQAGASWYHHGVFKNPERFDCSVNINGNAFKVNKTVAEEENTLTGWKAGITLVAKFSTGP